MNRSIQVEGAFGVLKQDYGFGRFLTRGKTNNETRLFILATAFTPRIALLKKKEAAANMT